MLPLVPPNDERAKQWNEKALNLIWVHGQLPAVVRALGRLDSFLRREDRKQLVQVRGEKFTSFAIVEDYLALSQLWVFGAYELLRSLDQKLGRGVPNISTEACRRVHDLKLQFARIRAPLAKLEPANSFRHTDELPKGACIVGNAQEKGWCWQLNASTFVWRHDLANDLLLLLDLFPNPSRRDHLKPNLASIV